MSTISFVSSTHKSAAREEISAQVKNFIAHGGVIKKLPSRVAEAKPIGPIWHIETTEVSQLN